MTIGIAAHGPRAGAALLEALRAVESVSHGEIRGFVTFAVITADGAARCFTTQRGGSAGLLAASSRGCATGADDLVSEPSTAHAPPRAVLEARLAGLISSGPDRPEPLERFIAIDADVGIVTGHRSPDAPSSSGTALNVEVLGLMARGASARDAVDRVLADNETADAGLIAVDLAGGVCARDSRRVRSRPDIGSAVRHDPTTGATVAVLHNAIRPVSPIASLAAETTLGVMSDWWAPDTWLTVRAGTPVELGDEELVVVDDEMVVRSVVTTDPSVLVGISNGAAIYLGARVLRAGRQVGVTVSEGNTVVSRGKIVSIGGSGEYRLGCRLSPAIVDGS